MNRIIFCATAALVCCGHLSFGQVFTDSEESNTVIRPIAFPQELEIPNPFDFTIENSPSSTTTPQAELSDSVEDPHSLSETRDQSVVDTIVDHSMLTSTPHASYEPVEWCQSINTPNPVGEMMMRQFCVDGLWDGYEAQRAYLCAHMWSKLSGHHTACNQCCPQPACANNSPCGKPTSGCAKPVRNRYRAAAATNRACDGNCATPNCEDCAQKTQLPAVVPVPILPVAVTSAVPAAAPSAIPAPPHPTGNRDYFAELKASVLR